MGMIGRMAVFAMAGFMLAPVYAQQGPQAGYRAINLSLDSDYVFYLSSGAAVDALGVYERSPGEGEKTAETIAATLIKRLRVLGVAPSAVPGKTVVRLEANPNEAQYLEAAANTGNIWLTLRKNGDVNDHPLAYSSWSRELQHGFRVAPAPLSRPAPGEACGAAAGGLPLNVSADASVIAGVQGRMREDYPALSAPIAADKVASVRPGDRIDVLATVAAAGPAGAKKHKRTVTLLQNILVLDIGNSVCRPSQRILLLALNYLQVQQAALAWDTAEIQVLARNASDTETYPMENAALSNLR